MRRDVRGKVEDDRGRCRAAPFAALVAVSSIVAAILYVAGFAFRWAYYYNFGLHHLVYELGVQVILMTAVELIRTPGNALRFLLWVLVPLLVVNAVLGLLRYASRPERTALPARALRATLSLVGLDSPLVVDAIRALVLVLATWMLGAELGYRTFVQHIVDSASNPLPAVTAIVAAKDGPAAALACGETQPSSLVIGGATQLHQMQQTFATCTRPGVTWRLLYRNSSSVFLFASDQHAAKRGTRPLTVVLPAGDSAALVIR